MTFWNAVGDVYLSICGVSAPFLLGVLVAQVFSLSKIKSELASIVDRIDGKTTQPSEKVG